ncbi:MAG TPA: deoxyribonuclease IV [Actinomycetota bacterium]|nr:deoxyribonuclease IV [Actinomycetota bacterium]
MRLGAHVPTRGGLVSAIEYAIAAGCEAIQLFVSNPRSWAPPTLTPDAAEEFSRRRIAARLGPVFAHTSYMVNIASPNPDFLMRSVDLARRELDAVAALGADGLVIHAGAGGPGERRAAVNRAAASILAILGDDAASPHVIVELTAGGAGSVASSISEAAELLRAVGHHPRVALCLDTCHLFAAGYPLDTASGVARCLAELREHRLTRRLKLVHANDAQAPRGSHRDRHEHVGEGFIGDEGFRAILADPAVRRAAVLIETPGRLEEDRRNLGRLQRLMR